MLGMKADVSFGSYLVKNWGVYVSALLGPAVVFFISFFVTNVGWWGLLSFVGVVLFMGLVVTYGLYREWSSRF